MKNKIFVITSEDTMSLYSRQFKYFLFDLQRFDSTFSGGDGSKDNPYKISNLADLIQLATDVNNSNSYQDK